MAPLTLDSPIAILGIKTEAPKILAQYGRKTVRQLMASKRHEVAKFDGMGDKRLEAIDAALAAHGLRWSDDRAGNQICKECPTCEECGNPRARHRGVVVRDFRGEYKHNGFDNLTPQCDGCKAHHRALFETAVAA